MINELKQQIKENLIYMDNLLELMQLEEYQNSDELDIKFKELEETTRELNRKVEELINIQD